MADLYGRNYRKVFISEPPDKAPPGESIGRISCLVEYIEWDVNGDPMEIGTDKPAADDIIYLGHIPKGAKILRITSFAKAADASFTFNLGSLQDDDMLASGVAASGVTPVEIPLMGADTFEGLEEDLLLVAKVTGDGANDASKVKIVVEYLAE